MTPTKKYRIESIDLLRGVVMVIMALDHVRDYFHFGSFYIDPTDLATTTPLLFFTRWITHFCAPVFVFLAGTSAFLYASRRETRGEVARFLFTRGLWLIFLEVTVVNFAWTFDATLSLHILQVIWAIGISMVILSGLIFLPRYGLLAIGILFVGAHNLLDAFTAEGLSPQSVAWYLLHQQQLSTLGNGSAVFFAYPVIPWIGLMILGYLFGTFYQKGYDAAERKKWLLRLGLGAIALFIVLRSGNFYGDLVPWQPQETLSYSIISFFNTTKYPPSLSFLLMTIGPALLFLYATENVKNRLSDALVTIGRVPLFYYVIHLYVVHLLAILGVLYAGQHWADMILTAKAFMSANLATYGYNLAVVYLVWGSVVLALYPLCKRYNAYKAANRDKWWLSYL